MSVEGSVTQVSSPPASASPTITATAILSHIRMQQQSSVSSTTTTTTTTSSTSNNNHDVDLVLSNGSSPIFNINNNSDSFYLPTWAIEPYHEAIAVPAVFGLIFVIGLVGNGTLIFIVAYNKVMRNMPNLLIVSLSLGDFLLILISVPLTSTVYTFSNWPYGPLACRLNHFLQTWSLGVTVFTLTALSVDRYLAIMDPMAKRKGQPQRRTAVVSLSIWVLAFLLALPDAVLSTETTRLHHPPPYHIRVCSNFPDHLVSLDQLVPKIYFVLRFVVFFAVPVLVIAWFYLMMAKTLIRSGRQMPCEGKTRGLNQERQIAARKKVARIVLSFVFIFVLCWLPRHVYLLWFFFDDSHYNEFWHYFKILGFCLTYLNSCVNPFALYILSSQFRKHYNRYLCCCLTKVKYTRMDPPSSTMHHLNSVLWRASPHPHPPPHPLPPHSHPQRPTSVSTSLLHTHSAF